MSNRLFPQAQVLTIIVKLVKELPKIKQIDYYLENLVQLSRNKKNIKDILINYIDNIYNNLSEDQHKEYDNIINDIKNRLSELKI